MQAQIADIQKRESEHLVQLEKYKETLEKTLLQNTLNKETPTVIAHKEKTLSLTDDLKATLENSTLEAYLKQIETLNQRIHFLDSKAFYYYDEMKSMLERLKLQMDANSMQESDLNEIKDQLERTRSSYEAQMSTMSDHIIEMTDRMTKQAEENENLKHELNVIGSQSNQNSLVNNSKNSSKSKKSK